MIVVRTIADVRRAVRETRARGATVGLVPTMGAFHAGHLSLMRAARMQTGFVIVSLFVNPAQFNDPTDLAAYPRDEARDAAMAAAEGVDVLFAPTADAIYPAGFATAVMVALLNEPLCGAFRGPEHFQGVATVVTKLFNIVTPDVAFFGQKDAQQAVIVRRLVRDLDLPVRVEVCPTVRESDGLAMSSRNVRLGTQERVRALALQYGLQVATAAIENGARDGTRIAELARTAMHDRGVEAEYVELVSAEHLRPMTPLAGEILVAVAAHVGSVRLIDNVVIRVPPT
jgi:pantoate--beta-alanine ligase